VFVSFENDIPYCELKSSSRYSSANIINYVAYKWCAKRLYLRYRSSGAIYKTIEACWVIMWERRYAARVSRSKQRRLMLVSSGHRQSGSHVSQRVWMGSGGVLWVHGCSTKGQKERWKEPEQSEERELMNAGTVGGQVRDGEPYSPPPPPPRSLFSPSAGRWPLAQWYEENVALHSPLLLTQMPTRLLVYFFSLCCNSFFPLLD